MRWWPFVHTLVEQGETDICQSVQFVFTKSWLTVTMWRRPWGSLSGAAAGQWSLNVGNGPGRGRAVVNIDRQNSQWHHLPSNSVSFCAMAGPLLNVPTHTRSKFISKRVRESCVGPPPAVGASFTQPLGDKSALLLSTADQESPCVRIS